MHYALKKAQGEKEELDALYERAKAAKTLFARESKALLELIGRRRIRAEVDETIAALHRAKFSAGIRDEIAAFFDRIDAWLKSGQQKLSELQTMVDKIYQRFAEEYGLACERPAAPPQYQSFIGDLARVREVALEQVAGWSVLFLHGKRRVVEQFTSLVGREVEARWERRYRQFLAWVRVVMVPMDEALAARADALAKRMKGLERITASLEQLEPQIAELEAELAEWERRRSRVAAAIDKVREVAGVE
jgi:exonuclease VII small subunit